LDQLDVFRMHNERLTKSLKTLQDDLSAKKRIVTDDSNDSGQHAQELEREHQDQMDALLEQFTAQSTETQQLSLQCADLRKQLASLSVEEQDVRSRLDVAIHERNDAINDLVSLEKKMEVEANQTKMLKESMEREKRQLELDLVDSSQVWATVWNGAIFSDSGSLNDVVKRLPDLSLALQECKCPDVRGLIDSLDLLSRVSDEKPKKDALDKLQSRLEALAKEWQSMDAGIAAATLSASKMQHPEGLIKMLATWYFEARGKEAWQSWTTLIYDLFKQLEFTGLNPGERNGKLAAKSMQSLLNALGDAKMAMDKLSALDHQLLDAHGTIAGLSEQVDGLQRELKLLKGPDGLVKTLEKQLGHAKDELTRLQTQQHQQLDASNAEWTQRLNNLQNEHKSKLDSLQIQRDQESASLKKSLETTITTHRASMDKLQQQFKQVSDREQVAVKELDRAKQELESQRAVMEQFTDEIAMRANEVEELKSQLDPNNLNTAKANSMLMDRVTYLEAQLARDSAKVPADVFKAKEQEIASLQQQLAEITRKSAGMTLLQDQLAHAMEQLAEKQRQLDELKDTNSKDIQQEHQEKPQKDMLVKSPYPTDGMSRFRAQLKVARGVTVEELLVQVEHLTKRLQELDAANYTK